MVYIIQITHDAEPFAPLVYVDKVFSNEKDAWDYLEKRYYTNIKIYKGDIDRVVINQCGIFIYSALCNKERSFLKFEIYRRIVS